jgi:hypothetical protein
MIQFIDTAVIHHLEQRRVEHCLIGAVALAVHGAARYTADIDLLTLNDDVLSRRFWEGMEGMQIKAGDPTDPVRGVVRWKAKVAHDLFVGRGYAGRFALDTSVPMPDIPCRVASPLGLVLLKLEAGGAQDRYDVISLIDARRALDGAPWLEELSRHLPKLSRDAREIWSELKITLPTP